MATGSKTYTEDGESSYKSTWVFSWTQPDIKVTGSTFRIEGGTVTAKYTYSGKTRADCFLNYKPRINGTLSSTEFYKANNSSASIVSWSSGATKTLVWGSGSPQYLQLNTSSYFNASNKTTRSIPLQYYLTIAYGESDKGLHTWENYIDQTKSHTGNVFSTAANITLDVPPTATVSVLSFDTPYIYAGLTTASVTVADTTAYYGGDIDSATLTIGEQSASISGDGTLSILLNAGGTFTPVVTITDSRGQTKDYTLDPITVGIYSTPTVNFDAQRTTNTGVLDDEGAYATIVTTLTFDSIAEAVAPSVSITDEDGNVVADEDISITWYSSRVDGILSGVISDWATVTSGSTVYGLISITGDFDTQKAYVISLTPQDSEGITGDPKTDTLQTAFYTVDFLAGGHGIAFGQPASQDGFYCNMDANFMEDVLIDLPDYQTTGTTDKAIYDAVVALGWDSDVIV